MPGAGQNARGPDGEPAVRPLVPPPDRGQNRLTLGPHPFGVELLDELEDVAVVVTCPGVFAPVRVSAETDPQAAAPMSNAAATTAKRTRERMAPLPLSVPVVGP
jgi:hypothetical protein